MIDEPRRLETRQKTTHPKAAPGASASNGVEFPSALSNAPLFPHHKLMVFAPMVPFRGYCRQKKMTITEMARPESSPADRTSRERRVSVHHLAYAGRADRDSQLYFVHHEKWRRRIM